MFYFFYLHVTRRKARSLLPLVAHSVHIIQIRSMAPIIPWDFIPQYTPFAIFVFLCSQALDKFYHGSTLSSSCHSFLSCPLKNYLGYGFFSVIHFLGMDAISATSLRLSIPYTAVSHIFLSDFIRFFSMSILLGANHAVSVLSVSLLTDLRISLVLHMYFFCTAGLWGKILVIISSVFEYEKGWALHNVVSYS